MKFASLKSSGRDGSVVLVNRQVTHYTRIQGIANRLQDILENWESLIPQCQDVYQQLNDKTLADIIPINVNELASPLPRAYQWLDGSAYLSHVERVRKARGAEMPPSFLTDPLMYQGGSDIFLPPSAPITAQDESWGIDFESEVAVVTNDVPQGVRVEAAGKHIKLLMLVNDISLRNLIPAELAKGFGFLHGKPPTAFSPAAITIDELGDAWQDYKISLPLKTWLNGELFGEPVASDDMQFNFAQLIAHAAKTRPLSAGTIIGSGTVSNKDLSKGCSCLAEKRVLEIIDSGEAKTPFLKFGDKVRIEMNNSQQESLFGAIEQEVVPWTN